MHSLKSVMRGMYSVCGVHVYQVLCRIPRPRPVVSCPIATQVKRYILTFDCLRPKFEWQNEIHSYFPVFLCCWIWVCLLRTHTVTRVRMRDPLNCWRTIQASYVPSFIRISNSGGLLNYRFLKKWLKMPRCANPSSLYLSSLHGGLALPSITTIHKSLQATKFAALSRSQDPTVRELASLYIGKHQHHGPTAIVHDTICHSSVSSKSQAKAAVKKKIYGIEDKALFDNIVALEVQGCFRRQGCEDTSTMDYWSTAVWALPSHIMSFTLNATQDTLPHNSYLVHWKTKVSPLCRLSGQLQTLRHVLNMCPVALKERRYDARHVM